MQREHGKFLACFVCLHLVRMLILFPYHGDQHINPTLDKEFDILAHLGILAIISSHKSGNTAKHFISIKYPNKDLPI